MEKYYYRVYGIEIESEIKIEEFLEIDELDFEWERVEIRYGNIPKDIMNRLKAGQYSCENRNDIYLYIEGVATYYISNGNKVIIDIYKNADKKMVNIYLLGSVLGILMIQRRQVAIHGATISKNNKAFILTGDRGAGKSTLTTALGLKGYDFLSDDVAAVSCISKPVISHGFPYQKLCEDAINKLDYDKSKCRSFIAEDKIKYLVPVKDKFIKSNVELNSIFEISISYNRDDVIIEEVIGHEKLEKILEHIYRKEYIKACGGMSKEYFKECVNIAKNIRFYKIIRPYGKFTLDDQIRLIEEIIS